MKLTPEQKKELLDAASALADGEPIQYQTADGKWWDTKTITISCPHRRKPKPALPHVVPLDSDDLIGCVMQPPTWKAGWMTINGAGHEYVYISPENCLERTVSFTALQTNGWKYHRIGDLDDEGKPVWRRCEKEAEQL